MNGPELLRMLALIRKEVQQQISKIPIPKDGEDGEDAVIPHEMIEELISQKVGAIKIPQVDDRMVDASVIKHLSKLPKPKEISSEHIRKIAQEALDAAEVPDLVIDKVATISHMEKGRAEIKKTGKGWSINLYIPVFRGNGNEWMGSGFVAQGMTAASQANQQFFVSDTLPIGNPSPALLYQTGQFSDPTILQPWVYY